MPDTTWTRFLGEWLEWSQGLVLSSLEAMQPRLANRRPTPTAPSAAFHAWHLARWADRHQAAFAAWFPERPALRDRLAGEELWVRDDLHRRWGMEGFELGDLGGIGAGLDDEASAALPLPDTAELVGYCRVAFTELQTAVALLDDEVLARRVIDLYGDQSTMADVIVGVMSHTDRHLGMIEAVRGVLGERGTATV